MHSAQEGNARLMALLTQVASFALVLDPREGTLNSVLQQEREASKA